MHEAQSSLVIYGSDETRYTACAFSDHYFDVEDLLDEVFSYDGIQEDPIAWNTEIDGMLPDANKPIWNPREYFMRMLEIRISHVGQEWTYLIRHVERCINQHVS
jgi:hypothetical protein